jgi:hypothetical protein
MPHLPPAHHETSKRDSSNEIKIKQNKTIPDSNSNLTKTMTHHNQKQETDHLVSQVGCYLFFSSSEAHPFFVCLLLGLCGGELLPKVTCNNLEREMNAEN